MPTERINAWYLIETPLEPDRAAEVLAGEQSSGTFVAVPGETDELKRRFGARVEVVERLETVSTPSLPGCRGGAGAYTRARVGISWSIENVGTNLLALVSMMQGNLYELSQFSGLRLLDFDLPGEVADHFRGPAFGAAGTRSLLGIADRPIFGTIVKPSVGLSPEQTAALATQLAEAGLDFIKDDELMANPPHSPFQQRFDAVNDALRRYTDRTGRRVMYAVNITDELDAMQRNCDRIVAAGGCCAMISINPAGLSAVKKIADAGALAIHGHRNGFGMLNRHPLLGMEFTAYQKLWRLAGVDQLHVNGIANKFWEPDDSVVRSIQACLAPFGRGQPVLPVVSSGQTGLQAPETWRRTRTMDLLYLAGGGIMAHPLGPAAGVAAIRQAWEAAVQGIELNTYAATRPALREQIARFGKTGA
jgi:ribulose-bisphosphate carboxylase large chain